MIQIDGFIGHDPEFRTPARLFVEAANANIAGMQQQLYFERDESEEHEPELTVVYTPNLKAEGYPDDRLIAVDLEQGVTRVFNSDYFGESKKGGLRMWNKLVYDRGGLPLHAGCKIIPTRARPPRRPDRRPLGDGQDDDDLHAAERIASRAGRLRGLDARRARLRHRERLLREDLRAQPRRRADDPRRGHAARLLPRERLAARRRRRLLRHELHAERARDVPVPRHRVGRDDEIEEAHFLLILNKNENMIPAVAKLEGPQAAAFFMLGETQGTSAGGADEAGKFLRVPGTNPFFPMPHDLQGNRFLELLEEHPLEVYLMNTGRVGGPEGDERSKKVRIKHSSAIVKGIAEGTIEWERDPDFGYMVASHVPGIDAEDIDILQPRRLYEATGRTDELDAGIERLKDARAEFLGKFPSLSEEIVESVH